MKGKHDKNEWRVNSNEFQEQESLSQLNSSQYSDSFIVEEISANLQKEKKNEKISQKKAPEQQKKLKTRKKFDEDSIDIKIEKSQRQFDKVMSRRKTGPSIEAFVKESVVVEDDPTRVVVVNHKPASGAYKLFVRSYTLDFGFICPLMLGLAFIIALVFLAIFLGVKSSQIKEFSIPYGSL
jgi:hypothetical protein